MSDSRARVNESYLLGFPVVLKPASENCHASSTLSRGISYRETHNFPASPAEQISPNGN